jgi:PAS domain S-box-containing protein
MNENVLNSEERTEIRKIAEEALMGKNIDLKKLSSVDIQNLVHELQVHQIELEMQNEELRRVQKELEDARIKYSDLYDFAPIGYFTFDKNGLILGVNLNGAKKLGRERSNLINKPFSLYIAPEYKNGFYSHLQQVFNTKTQMKCELRLVDNEGQQFDALLESLSFFGCDGNIAYRTTMSDITERKQAEEKFQKLNEELEQRTTEHTTKLETKNKDLESINKVFVGRELRMAELKKQIVELEKDAEPDKNSGDKTI